MHPKFQGHHTCCAPHYPCLGCVLPKLERDCLAQKILHLKPPFGPLEHQMSNLHQVLCHSPTACGVRRSRKKMCLDNIHTHRSLSGITLLVCVLALNKACLNFSKWIFMSDKIQMCALVLKITSEDSCASYFLNLLWMQLFLSEDKYGKVISTETKKFCSERHSSAS